MTIIMEMEKLNANMHTIKVFLLFVLHYRALKSQSFLILFDFTIYLQIIESILILLKFQ